MRDLELEKKLKRTQKTKPAEKKLPLSPELEKEIETAAAQLADEDIEQHSVKPELVSLNAYRAKLEEEYKESIHMRDAGISLSSAIFMIVQQGKRYLDLDAFTRVIDEFENAFDQLMKLDNSSLINNNFKELSGISDESIGNIEKIALQKYKEKDFCSSARLFFLLTVLCPNNFMYKIRLGINYQESENYQEALKAFSQAYSLNAVHIPNHLFMAECYIELNDKFHALNECELLKTLLELHDFDGKWKEHYFMLEKAVNEMS